MTFFSSPPGNNKMKSINGAAFRNLNQLRYVDLTLNACINKVFYWPSDFEKMTQFVTEKCGFDDSKTIVVAKQ